MNRHFLFIIHMLLSRARSNEDDDVAADDASDALRPVTVSSVSVRRKAAAANASPPRAADVQSPPPHDSSGIPFSSTNATSKARSHSPPSSAPAIALTSQQAPVQWYEPGHVLRIVELHERLDTFEYSPRTVAEGNTDGGDPFFHIQSNRLPIQAILDAPFVAPPDPPPPSTAFGESALSAEETAAKLKGRVFPRDRVNTWENVIKHEKLVGKELASVAKVLSEIAVASLTQEAAPTASDSVGEGGASSGVAAEQDVATIAAARKATLTSHHDAMVAYMKDSDAFREVVMHPCGSQGVPVVMATTAVAASNGSSCKKTTGGVSPSPGSSSSAAAAAASTMVVMTSTEMLSLLPDDDPFRRLFSAKEEQLIATQQMLRAGVELLVNSSNQADELAVTIKLNEKLKVEQRYLYFLVAHQQDRMLQMRLSATSAAAAAGSPIVGRNGAGAGAEESTPPAHPTASPSLIVAGGAAGGGLSPSASSNFGRSTVRSQSTFAASFRGRGPSSSRGGPGSLPPNEHIIADLVETEVQRQLLKALPKQQQALVASAHAAALVATTSHAMGQSDTVAGTTTPPVLFPSPVPGKGGMMSPQQQRPVSPANAFLLGGQQMLPPGQRGGRLVGGGAISAAGKLSPLGVSTELSPLHRGATRSRRASTAGATAPHAHGTSPTSDGVALAAAAAATTATPGVDVDMMLSLMQKEATKYRDASMLNVRRTVHIAKHVRDLRQVNRAFELERMKREDPLIYLANYREASEAVANAVQLRAPQPATNNSSATVHWSLSPFTSATITATPATTTPAAGWLMETTPPAMTAITATCDFADAMQRSTAGVDAQSSGEGPSLNLLTSADATPWSSSRRPSVVPVSRRASTTVAPIPPRSVAGTSVAKNAAVTKNPSAPLPQVQLSAIGGLRRTFDMAHCASLSQRLQSDIVVRLNAAVNGLQKIAPASMAMPPHLMHLFATRFAAGGQLPSAVREGGGNGGTSEEHSGHGTPLRLGGVETSMDTPVKEDLPTTQLPATVDVIFDPHYARSCLTALYSRLSDVVAVIISHAAQQVVTATVAQALAAPVAPTFLPQVIGAWLRHVNVAMDSLGKALDASIADANAATAASLALVEANMNHAAAAAVAAYRRRESEMSAHSASSSAPPHLGYSNVGAKTTTSAPNSPKREGGEPQLPPPRTGGGSVSAAPPKSTDRSPSKMLFPRASLSEEPELPAGSDSAAGGHHPSAATVQLLSPSQHNTNSAAAASGKRSTARVRSPRAADAPSVPPKSGGPPLSSALKGGQERSTAPGHSSMKTPTSSSSHQYNKLSIPHPDDDMQGGTTVEVEPEEEELHSHGAEEEAVVAEGDDGDAVAGPHDGGSSGSVKGRRSSLSPAAGRGTIKPRGSTRTVKAAAAIVRTPPTSGSSSSVPPPSRGGVHVSAGRGASNIKPPATAAPLKGSAPKSSSSFVERRSSSEAGPHDVTRRHAKSQHQKLPPSESAMSLQRTNSNAGDPEKQSC